MTTVAIKRLRPEARLPDQAYEAALRRAGRATARHFAWPEVLRTNLVPRLALPRTARTLDVD